MNTRQFRAFLILIIVSCAAVLAYSYYSIVEKPFLNDRITLHFQILIGSAQSPYQYRVLVPYLAESLSRMLTILLPYRYAFALSYIFMDFSALMLLLWSSYTLLNRWYDWQFALIGMLFISSVIIMTYFDHWYQPWSFWEAAFYTYALLLMEEKKYYALAGIVLLASLNRETGLLIPIAFFCTSFNSRSFDKNPPLRENTFFWFVIYGTIWLVVFWGLRELRPAMSVVQTVMQIFIHNTIPIYLIKTLINWGLFLGGFWILVILGYQNAPFFLQKVTKVLFIHIPLILVWGYWHEVRMLMPHNVVLVGLGLAALKRTTLVSPKNE